MSNPFLNSSMRFRSKSLFHILIHLNHANKVLTLIIDCSMIATFSVSAVALIPSFCLARRTGTMDFIFRVLMQVIVILPTIIFMPASVNPIGETALPQSFSLGYITIIFTHHMDIILSI